MSNIIDSIRLSGTTYKIQGSGGGGTQAIELTQAQYDALVDKDPNVFYIITDAEAGDLTNYYTKSETSGATQISTALASKQDTLQSGTNIKTINNESILGSGNIDIQGGGKAVSGGTNISITTGETADTINCTLPMSTDSVKKIVVNSNYSSFVTSNAVFTASSLSNSILLGNNTFNIKGIIKGDINNNLIIGSYNTSNLKNGTKPTLEGNLVVGSNNVINSSYSLLVGNNNTISRSYQFAVGYKQHPNNDYETSLGNYNVSSSGSLTFGDSGNTLFSVGNGTSESARHNAFEIRQNGDIYLTKDGQDVKLQDQLGGGSITVDSALSPTSENPVQNKVLFDELRITESEGSETKLIWEEVGYNDFRTTNFPSGYTTIKVIIKEGQAVSFLFHNSNGVSLGKYNIYSIESVEVDNQFDGSTYTVDGNNVTITWDASKDVVELRTDGSGEIYDYMAEFYAVDEPVYSTLKEVVSGKVDTSAITTSVSSSSTDAQVPSAKAVNDKLGGLSLVKLTQAEYDALSPNYDSNTLYVIVN